MHNEVMDESSKRLIALLEFQQAAIPPELTLGKLYCFRNMDRKSAFYGWSIEGEIVDVIPAHTRPSFVTIERLYGVSDLRTAPRLARGIRFARLAVKNAQGMVSVVVFDKEVLQMSCKEGELP